jgi:hypothetical protein
LRKKCAKSKVIGFPDRPNLRFKTQKKYCTNLDIRSKSESNSSMSDVESTEEKKQSTIDCRIIVKRPCETNIGKNLNLLSTQTDSTKEHTKTTIHEETFQNSNGNSIWP